MPQLLLLRHAKSSWAGPATRDHDRALSRRGVADAARVGEYLAGHALAPDLILTSSARRARQTADAVLNAITAQVGATQTDIQAIEALYNASLPGLLETIRRRGAGADVVLVVGHNPSIAQAAARLGAGQTGAAARRARGKYPTAALTHFDTGTVSLAELDPPAPRLVLFRAPSD